MHLHISGVGIKLSRSNSAYKVLAIIVHSCKVSYILLTSSMDYDAYDVSIANK